MSITLESHSKDLSAATGTLVRSQDNAEKYEQILRDIARTGFPKFLNSKMYRSWRAHEKGSVLSFVGLIHVEDDFETSLSFATSSRSSIQENSSQSSPTPSPTLHHVKVPLKREASFAERALSSVNRDEAEILVNSSSWLFTLLSGVESGTGAEAGPPSYSERELI